MTGNLRAVKGKVFRNQGIVDAQLWKSLQGALFLEPCHNLSRVEAYPFDLLVPPVVKIPKLAITKIDPAVPSPTIMAHDDNDDDKEDENEDEDVDDPNMPQFFSLRTPEDITDYIGRTRKFRAFFIRQKYSWGPLLITSRLFAELMVRARISPRLKSFILYLGARDREVEITLPALRFIRLSSDEEASQRGHECLYGLRFVERNGRNDTEKPSRGWSLRQSAIFCRYTLGDDGVSWLFITISQHMQHRLNSIVADSGSLSDFDPFEIHFLLIDSAISSWRHYLVDLSAETDSQYAQLLGISPSNEGPVDLHRSDRRQELLTLDEKLLNSLLATSATADTLSSLLSAWESQTEFPQTSDASYTELIRTAFEDQKRDLHLITSQLETLRSKVSGATNVLSSFLELSSGFSLQNLVKQSGKESEEMRKLSERMHTLAKKNTQDAAAVKVLTILTMIYLPITVVSNFFSTSFVNSKTTPDGSGSIMVSGDWWILPAVSIPLTFTTIYVWLVWTRIQGNPSNQPWWWYIIGIHLLSGQSKPVAHSNGVEKQRKDGTEPLSYGGETNEEGPARILPGACSEIC
jgi:Mg2+ and Co2+ transporter CorA